MAVTRILSLNPTLNPTLNPKPLSFSLRSSLPLPLSLPSVRLSLRASNSERVIEFEEADPTLGDEKKKKGEGMLMSQKITLGYAAFMLAGGIMGYVKSGSQKSALAGLISALLLGIVYKLLPVFPTLASVLGLAMSGALVQTMFSRFMKSGKVFPAGIVCLVSLIMFVGYGHGIFRH